MFIKIVLRLSELGNCRSKSLMSYLAVLSVLTVCSAQECPSAQKYVEQQSYMKAITEYTVCYNRDTTARANLLAIAECYYLLGDWQKSKEIYHKLENMEAYSYAAYVKLAAIYEAQQNQETALKYYQLLHKKYPENPLYLRKSAILYIQNGNLDNAINSYKTALKLNERDLVSVLGLAEIYYSLKDFYSSDSLLTNGLQMDSLHVGLSLLLSRVKHKNHDYLAVTKILQSLTDNTKLSNYYKTILGYSYLMIDSLDKSILYLEESLENEDNPEYALYYLGLVYERKMDYTKAESYFKQAIDAGISTDISDYYNSLARIYSVQKDYKKALDHYTTSLEYEHNPKIYYYMGNIAENHYTNKKKAISYYQEFLKSSNKKSKEFKIAQERLKLLEENEFMRKK
jgi:tetratricopeptide (TPR) repeat protein